ncbi:hypothetical protein DL771_000133 [Monosporascus sp. 5C6A]|nr:hypothetical protein DL771_000133 [Monosporascus sp. 5C6A]
MADRLPFLTLSSRRPADGSSMSSGDSAYGSSPGDEKAPSATHDISRVNYHIKHLPDFARTLEESAARAFPNRGHSQRYKKVHVLLLHWRCDDLFVLPELEDLETCFREDYNFETETFSIPSDNAHLDLMLKIGAMIKEYESQDTLFIVYYGGHARIDNSRQSTWCANRSSDSPWLHITETISASSWDAIAPDPGRYSFTSALIEVLQEWKDRTFSAAMVHAEVLARLKHPRPERRNGKHFEARSTPVHFMMTANHRAPSIEISRTVSCDMRPPSPPQELMFEDSSSAGRYAGPQEIIGSEPSEDVPHVMISLALEDDQRLNINDWEHWLQSIPAIAKYVKVQGVFKSHSTLLLLSMPVMVWDLLPENHACNFVAFVRSNNLALKCRGDRVPVEEEIPVSRDTDVESRFSMFSGTTAYTDGRRPSVMSFVGPGARSAPGPNQGASSIYSRVAQLPDQIPRAWSNSNLGTPIRQQHTAPPMALVEAMSHQNFSRIPILNHQRDSRRTHPTSVDNLPARPQLAPHVQSRLEEYFLDNPRPTDAVKEFLASNLGIETIDLDLWFFHRREQQEVENRLQSLRIDDHSHDRPREAPRMILPGHLNRLLEVVPSSQVLIVDLRSPADYERSHIYGAINYRAPASFVSRATLELVEKALPNEATCSVFRTWYDCKCVVFYDRHVEFAWEAPTAEALYQKFRTKGWTGQCFVLKGHYREFSESFDKYIVGIKMTDNARAYLPSLQEKTREETDAQLYEEWFKQLEDEDRHHTDLVPTVKAERMEAMVRHQKKVEDEFERHQPSLHRKALDLQPAVQDGRWDVKGPMVAPLARGIAKLHDTGTGAGSGKAAGADTKTSYQSYPGKSRHQEKHLATPPGVEDYDLLESDEEQLASERVARRSRTESKETLRTDDVAAEKKQTRMHGGRGFFNKLIRSGRADGSR